MTVISGVSPYSGADLAPTAEASSTDDVARVVAAAAAAAGTLEGMGRAGRAALLRAVAAGLTAHTDELVAVADAETGIGPVRLRGELKRTSFQMEFFAEVLEDGGYLEAVIDPAGDTPMGPRPDLRRILQPIGPVGVFGSSNFPFAFSVIGGDTASALAAGSPVVIKAHSSHPGTSLRSFEVMKEALASAGAPEGVVGLVFGQRAGIDLVTDGRIHAVGFTGSLSGGQALLAAIDTRPHPIPFYGELSSINPVIITAAAAVQRGAEIASGLAESITVSAGQLCTKPGVVFVPAGAAGDVVVERLGDQLARTTVSPLLNRRIFDSYRATTEAWAEHPGVERLAAGSAPAEAGFHVAPAVFSVEPSSLGSGIVEECFGPAAIVVRYGDVDELEKAMSEIANSLTVTLHIEEDEDALAARLTELARSRSGRVIFNGYPTGVSVSWAQTHGGPWPSTNSLHSSVGATAIRRFLRPVTYQNAPALVLPAELRDGDPVVPTRFDGRLVLPVRRSL